MRPQRSSFDLLAAISLALLALAAVVIPLDPWLRVVLLAPLVLAVSGYATLAALLPVVDLPAGERVVYAVALSVSVTVLGGIVVQLALGLDRTAWAVLVAALTVVAALVALRRRRDEPAFERPAGKAGEPSAGLPWPGLGSVAALALALGVAVWAIAISSAGARRERDAYHFTALWAQPAQSAAGGQAVTVGIDNHQGASGSFLLLVKQGGMTIARRTIQLADGNRWRLRVPVEPISGADPVVVILDRDGEIYRRVYLQSEVTP